MGNRSLLAAGPRALVLTSAQGKAPRGGDAWLAALAAAIRQVGTDGGVLIGSAAPLPWDIALILAAAAKVPVILIATQGSDALEADFWRWVANYQLDANRLLLLSPISRAHRKSGWRQRDALAWSLAERVIPISIRPGGRLAAGLIGLPETRLDRRWHVEYDPHPWTPSIVVPTLVRGEGEHSEWLVHWTRRTYQRWPDETMASFCQAILESTERWCRDAPATLEHILATGILRGSRFRSAGGAPVVSFTGATPSEMRRNFRWCARKVAPMWEPWGIAIRREALIALGGHPVMYGMGESEIPAWCRHSGGPFTGEVEWRVHGDLRLADIPSADWHPIFPSGAQITAKSTGANALSWEEWIAASSDVG